MNCGLVWASYPAIEKSPFTVRWASAAIWPPAFLCQAGFAAVNLGGGYKTYQLLHAGTNGG